MKNNLIFKVLIMLTLAGCGTDTGNPTMTSYIPVSSIVSPITDQIAYYMCYKVSSCFTPVLSNCENKIRVAPGISAALGLNQTSYPNFDTIQTAINSGQLIVNSNKRQTCFESFLNSSCSNSTIQQAYQTSDLENLSQSWKILTLDNNCNQFFN